jgi:hypothetical protein
MKNSPLEIRKVRLRGLLRGIFSRGRARKGMDDRIT